MAPARSGLSWAAAALLASGAWLARPATPAPAPDVRSPLRALLVDTSASVRATRPGWRGWVVRALFDEARRARDEGEDVLVVSYADGVEQTFPAAPAAALLDALSGRGGTPFDPTGSALGPRSDLAAAAAVAAAALAEPGRAPGRLVLLGDGRWTGEPPGAALRRAAAACTEIRREAPPASASGDLALAAARVPRVAPEGAAVALELVVDWTPPGDGGAPGARARGPGALRVEIDELTTPGGAAPVARRIELQPLAALERGGARRRAELRVVLDPLPPGSHGLTVRVRPASGPDPHRANDGAFVLVRVGEAVRVVAVADDPAVAAALRAAARRPALEALELRVVELEALAAEAFAADVLWTVGVPLGQLPSDVVRAHLDGGGGWLHAAGTELLRLDGGPASGWLALEPDPAERPPRDLLFLADGSGSMGGPRWDRLRAALVELVPEVSPGDRVTLRFFNRLLGRVALDVETGDPAVRAEALEAVLRAEVPGGQTDVVGVLEELAGELARTPPPDGRRTLVLLLTDGVSDSVAHLAEGARLALDAQRADLVVVQVGEEPSGRAFLELLLREGEALVAAGELDRLVDQLRDRIHGDDLVRDTAAVGAADARGAAAAVARAARAWAAPTPVAAAVRARLAPGAEAAWEASSGEPLLAVVARGPGRVATLATLPAAGWCHALAGDLTLLAPTLLALADGERPGEAPTLGWSGVAADRVELSGAGTGWPLDLELVVRDRDRRDTLGRLLDGPVLARAPLVPTTAPGLDPRTVRVADLDARLLDAAPRGARLACEVVGADGKTWLRAWLPAPGAPERTARERGPVALPPAGGAFRRPVPAPSSAAPVLLVLGVLALAAAVWPQDRLPRRRARA